MGVSHFVIFFNCDLPKWDGMLRHLRVLFLLNVVQGPMHLFEIFIAL